MSFTIIESVLVVFFVFFTRERMEYRSATISEREALTDIEMIKDIMAVVYKKLGIKAAQNDLTIR